MEQEPAGPGFGAVEEIFHAALEIADPGRRRAYLDTTCQGTPLLRRQIEELLGAAEQAKDHDHFLADQPSRFQMESPGLRIGRYTLMEQLGAGGHGVVWKAAQEKPLRREVALKIIKAGMDTQLALARFDTERQALALMDHPGIAKVFDAGATETGRPYFVMELVAGIRITDFCDQQRLAIPERVALFIKVCHAIQHAHEKGIIHRDLKPSNILVVRRDGAAVPKVIDFGIAKAADQFPGGTPLLTVSGQFMGTPVYMSPEQAGGKNRELDARSDLYSLGVLLYELLTGRTPLWQTGIESLALDQILRAIRESRPLAPSDLMASLPAAERTSRAQACGTQPGDLLKSARGPLDWMVMKCLEKNPARRYQTARDLAEDLERHLGGKLPCHARPPSHLQYARAWLARHKVVAIIAGLVVLALAWFSLASAGQTSEWATVIVQTKARSAPLKYNWADIFLEPGETWLVGNIDEMGGGRSLNVGHGVMVHQAGNDQAWDLVNITNFASGVGTNAHFNDEVWTEVGPMTSVQISESLSADGVHEKTNGWISSVTGIYLSTNAGDLHARWSRMTPPPDGPEGYSRFATFIGLENYTELYAVGWQGISHWDGAHWQLQKRTFNYLIKNIIEAGGELWAVGGSEKDEFGWTGSNSHGAIYHLAPGSTNWETVALPDIKFFPGQSVNDITFVPRYATLLAVGDKGMLLRGYMEGTRRVWRQIPFGRENDLMSVAWDEHDNLWAVGSRGLIIKSTDQGSTWKKCICRDETGAILKQNLIRIRIYGTNGWIMGQKILLRKVGRQG